MYVEHIWLPHIWLIYRMSSEGLHGMPSMWSKHGHMMFLDGTLTNTHPYWRDRIAFNGQLEQKFAPTWVSPIEFVKRVEEQEEGLRIRTW
jgi:hypothetical protein